MIIFGAFFAAVGLQPLICRVLPAKSPLLNFMLGALPIGACLAWDTVRTSGLSTGLAAASFYALLCEVHVFLIALLPQSVSFQLLRMLSAGDRSPDEIEAALSGKAMVDRRIAGLRKAGLLTRDDRDLRVTKKGRFLVRLYRKARAFFGHADAPLWAPRSSR